MNTNLFIEDNIGRKRTLQGVRFLFVLLIYISHCTSPNITTQFDFGGELGVSFFFILSGFVLSWGYGPRISRGEFSTRQFFERRFWRIYPLHLLLYTIVLSLDWRIGHFYDWTQKITTLLLVQSWIPSNHTLYVINPVSWFLCDIIFFYVIFKHLYSYIIKIYSRKLTKLLIVFITIYLIVAWQVPKDIINCTLYTNPLLRTFDFALGIFAYKVYKTQKLYTLKHNKRKLMPLTICFISGLTIYGIYQLLNGNGIRCAALFWPFIPLFIIYLASIDGTPNHLARLFSSSPMLWLGNISFEIFMIHLVAMRLTQHVIKTDGSLTSDYVYFFTAFCVTIVMAWGLHRCFVKPITNAIIGKRYR